MKCCTSFSKCDSITICTWIYFNSNSKNC